MAGVVQRAHAAYHRATLGGHCGLRTKVARAHRDVLLQCMSVGGGNGNGDRVDDGGVRAHLQPLTEAYGAAWDALRGTPVERAQRLAALGECLLDVATWLDTADSGELRCLGPALQRCAREVVPRAMVERRDALRRVAEDEAEAAAAAAGSPYIATMVCAALCLLDMADGSAAYVVVSIRACLASVFGSESMDRWLAGRRVAVEAAEAAEAAHHHRNRKRQQQQRQDEGGGNASSDSATLTDDDDGGRVVARRPEPSYVARLRAANEAPEEVALRAARVARVQGYRAEAARIAEERERIVADHQRALADLARRKRAIEERNACVRAALVVLDGPPPRSAPPAPPVPAAPAASANQQPGTCGGGGDRRLRRRLCRQALPPIPPTWLLRGGVGGGGGQAADELYE